MRFPQPVTGLAVLTQLVERQRGLCFRNEGFFLVGFKSEAQAPHLVELLQVGVLHGEHLGRERVQCSRAYLDRMMKGHLDFLM